MAQPMTVAVRIVSFEEYDAKRLQGVLLQGEKIPCPKCSRFTLQQSASAVERPLRTTAPAFGNSIGVRAINVVISLARCRSCGHRPRILPAHLQPYKRTTTDLIEETVRRHVETGESLRRIAARVEGDSISHSAIHGWSEGLGDYALGNRTGEVPDAAPALRIVAEAERRHPELREIPRRPTIGSAIYRSEGRRVRLQAALRLLQIARKVSVASPLADLSASFLAWTSSCHGLAFRSGRRCTYSEHPT